MKIIVPIDEEQKTICPSFGRCPFFGIYNSETHTMEYMENPAADAEGGAGIAAGQFVVDAGVDAVLTKRAGENAAELICVANIKIFKAESYELQENIKALLENKLEEMKEFHKGFIHG